jgi:hypothetical protein
MWTGSIYPWTRRGGNPSVHNGLTGNLSAELAGVGPRRRSGEPFIATRVRGGRWMGVLTTTIWGRVRLGGGDESATAAHSVGRSF